MSIRSILLQRIESGFTISFFLGELLPHVVASVALLLGAPANSLAQSSPNGK